MKLTVKDVAPGQLYDCHGHTLMRVVTNCIVDNIVLNAMTDGYCKNYANPILIVDINTGRLDWEDGDLPIDKIQRLGTIDRTLVAENFDDLVRESYNMAL